MNIQFNNLPSITELIKVMDVHRFGASLAVVALLILSLAVVFCAWMYFNHRK